MDQTGLAFNGLHEVGIYCLNHPGCHCTGNLEILGGDGLSCLVVCHNDLANALPEVLEIRCNSKDRHDLGRNGNVKTALHGHAIHASAKTQGDIPEALGTEVNNPLELNALWMDIKPLQVTEGKLLVSVVGLMLHACSERNHTQVVGIHNGIDVAGKAK